MSNKEYNLFSGGLKGAEQTFGECAEKHGVTETNYSFEGHKLGRDKNVVILNDEELSHGQVSMDIVATKMGRGFGHTDTIRKVFQVIFHMINKGEQVFAIGWIRADKTVKGGTGWGIELAKFFNRKVSVFDQETNKWFSWSGNDWVKDTPVISEKTFCGTGTRNITDSGKQAVEELFSRSFSK